MPTTEKFHLHIIAPIDYRWDMLHTVADVLASMATGDGRGADDAGHTSDPFLRMPARFISDYQAVLREVTARGYCEELGEEPSVLWLPGDTEFRYAFVLKDRNNGTTIIASPFEMPWLAPLSVA